VFVVGLTGVTKAVRVGVGVGERRGCDQVESQLRGWFVQLARVVAERLSK
jgi:hypothetical protein